MQNTTLAIAILGVILVLFLRPAHALATYISVLFWYPTYLVLSIGTIELPVGRIVVTVLLLRCLCDRRIRSKFMWSRLDTWVALSMAVYVMIYCVSQSSASSVENRGGFLMDTWFAYMAVRLCVTSYERFIVVVKWVAIILVPLAVLGVLESVWGWAPFRSWFAYALRFDHFRKQVPRWGLARAQGLTSQPIIFGLAFVIFLPLVYYLRHQKCNWRVWSPVLSGIAAVGALSSMSSGPWVMLIVAVFCLIMEKYKYLVKPLLLFLLFSCVSIAIISNRPFYHVLASYANPLGGAGWHRAKLIDCAIESIDEWWLIGYGGKDPGWGEQLGMGGTDVTNEFVLAGVKYGILGVIALVAVLVKAFRDLTFLHNRTADPILQSLYWSLGGVLVAIVVAFMSVSFFGPTETMFYCILGLVGASGSFSMNRRPLLLRCKTAVSDFDTDR